MLDNMMRRKIARKMLEELRSVETRETLVDWYLKQSFDDQVMVSELINIAEVIGISIKNKVAYKRDISKENLQDLIKIYSIKDISVLLNVSVNTVNRRLKEFNI